MTIASAVAQFEQALVVLSEPNANIIRLLIQCLQPLLSPTLHRSPTNAFADPQAPPASAPTSLLSV
jgi:hypothetical protein